MSTNTSTNQLELFPIPYNHAEFLLLKSGLHFLTTASATIPKPIVSRFIPIYYKLYWQGIHLLSRIESGCIVRDGITYNVIYGKGLTRGKIIANIQAQYCLSFRKAADQYHLKPVVFITVANGD